MKQPFLNINSGFADAVTDPLYLAPSAGQWLEADPGDLTPALTMGDLVTAGGTIGRPTIKRFSPANGGSFGPGSGVTETYTLYVNGVATSVVVTIADSTNEGSYTGSGATVSVGDVYCWVRTVSGNAGACFTSVSYLFTGSSRMRSMHGANFQTNNVSVTYIAPMAGRNLSTTEFDPDGSNIVGCYGDMTYHAVKLTAAPGSGKSYTFDLLVDGVAVPGAQIVISDAELEGEASFTAALLPVVMDAGAPQSAANRISLRITPSGSPTVARVSYGCRFVATDLEFVNEDTMVVEEVIDDNVSNFCLNIDTLASNNFNNYGNAPVTNTTVDPNTRQGKWCDVDGTDFNVALANMGIQLTTAPGGVAEREFTPMKYDDGVPGWVANVTLGPVVEGATTFNGMLTSSGSTQFSHYLAGENRRFVVKQLGTGTPAATDALTAFMAFADGFEADGATFDGTVTSIAPDEGPVSGGTAFTITGTGFQGTVNGGTDNVTGVAGVTLRGIAATSVMVVNDTTITGVSGVSINPGLGDVVITFTTDALGSPNAMATLSDAWTYTTTDAWWVFETPDADDMDALGLGGQPPLGPIYYYGEQPTGAVAASEPGPNGWWFSGDGLRGAPGVSDGEGNNPQQVRQPAKIASFCTGAANHLMGQPGCAVAYRNRLIYAGGDYTIGTDRPSIRLFDGASDRHLAFLPLDASGNEAEAIMAMLVANNTIYLSTLDNTAGGGRVFEFNLDTLLLTLLGTFSGDEVPYCLAWHNGQLFVGTNEGDGSTGKIYRIRPGVESAFTTDYTLSSSTAGGALSMAVLGGNLYIGTDNVNTVAGKVLKRNGSTGAYTTVETGSGTAAMNGYTSLIVFEEKLYAAYWSSASTVSLIRRTADGASWSTVYTGAGDFIIPIVSLFVHDGSIYALFGDADTAARLIVSTSGDSASYTDVTAFLVDGDILPTPAFASLRF